MPLPDAEPKPNKANIYEQFSHIKVQDFTRENLDVVRKPLNLNSESEDVLRRILLVGLASDQLSIGGPIPGSMDVFKIIVDTSGSGVTGFGDGLATVPLGQVWQLYGLSIAPQGVSGTISSEVRIFGPGNISTEFVSGSSSSGSSYPLQEDFGPFFIGGGSKIQYEATGTFTTMELRYCAVRVR